MTDSDLDVLTIGMMMGEVSPPRFGVRIGEADHLLLFPSGSATIFSLALARLGGRIGLISRVGDDELGWWMQATLAAEGIDTAGITSVPGQLTPLSLASVDDRGEKTFAYYRFPDLCDPLNTLRSEEIGDAHLRRARVFDFTESSLRSPVLRETSLRLARRARDLGLTVCYNPNYRPSAWTGGSTEAADVQREAVRLADLVVLNEAEACLIAGASEARAAGRRLVDLGPSLVVMTRGPLPVLVVSGAEVVEVPAVPADVVFDIGAGDVFHAGFLAEWKPGADPVRCATFAAHASALKISRPPQLTELPTRAEVMARMGGDDQLATSWTAPMG